MSDRSDGRQALIYCAFAAGVVFAVASATVIWSRKWALQTNYGSGTIDYLRNGTTAGEGPVAWFRFRREAEQALNAIRPALPDDVAVRVVPYR